MAPVKSIAIIGAGASGAAAANAFAAEKYFDTIKVFERREEPGGTWIYDAAPPELDLVPGALPYQIDPPLRIPPSLPTTVRANTQERFHKTPIYDGLTTNVPEIAMSLSDRRFPYGPFVPHWVPKNYIREHFSVHGHDKLLNLNTTVERVTKIAGDRWHLVLRRHDALLGRDEWWEEEFDAVVFGNGHYSVPHVPFVPGLAEYLLTFPGRVTHSKSYRNPKQFTNQRVLVIGNSASGHDVAEQLRTSPLVQHPVLQSRRSRSLWEGDKPPDGLVWKPVISEYTVDGTIVFEDGSTLAHNEIDAVVYSTGYRPSYPFWDAETNGRDLYDYEANRFTGTFQHTFVPDYPTLGLIGIPRTLTFRSFEYQAIALARVWSGRARLPPREEQRQWEADRVKERGLSHKKFHDIEWDTGETEAFLTFLFQLAGLPLLDGTGLTPPILNASTRWALENIRKYPILRPTPPSAKEGHGEGATESDWVVVGPWKDSLSFI